MVDQGQDRSQNGEHSEEAVAAPPVTNVIGELETRWRAELDGARAEQQRLLQARAAIDNQLGEIAMGIERMRGALGALQAVKEKTAAATNGTSGEAAPADASTTEEKKAA
jgi:hypothetical protein